MKDESSRNFHFLEDSSRIFDVARGFFKNPRVISISSRIPQVFLKLLEDFSKILEEIKFPRGFLEDFKFSRGFLEDF